jgi:hypothetical protein
MNISMITPRFRAKPLEPLPPEPEEQKAYRKKHSIPDRFYRPDLGIEPGRNTPEDIERHEASCVPKKLKERIVPALFAAGLGWLPSMALAFAPTSLLNFVVPPPAGQLLSIGAAVALGTGACVALALGNIFQPFKVPQPFRLWHGYREEEWEKMAKEEKAKEARKSKTDHFA